MAKNYDIFISYAKEDRDLANKIYDELSNNGVSLWFDAINLLPGQNWKTAIPVAIKESSYFLLLFSSHSVSKVGYVQKEQKFALEILDEFPTNEIFIIPARLDDCQPTDERLKDIHWVDLYPTFEDGIDRILRVLGKSKNPSTSTISHSDKVIKQPISETNKEDNLTDFEAYYLGHAIKNRSFFLKKNHWTRWATSIILLYFLSIDAIGKRESTDVKPYEPVIIGGHKLSLNKNYEEYEKIDLHIRMTLTRFIREKLQRISKCFESDFIFVNQYGKEKLKNDHPEIYSEMEL
ncbi:MAG: toll/interleukin-1 receptor domain-containing protein [Anaerolineales bacterium]|nr:toll/interleukin-1 receptor domain-containing protein [Anaerolineales bacterium]